eukprot:Skav217007  [mRNA]  locus=scaffold1803:156753:157655:+ [translate_table: standard]
MTEFRKASAAVETVEKLIVELQQDQASHAQRGELPVESHSRWTEVQKHFQDLSPVAEKMQRRCEARSQLEGLKEEMQSILHQTSPEEVMKKAQEIVDSKSEGFEEIQSRLAKALELEAAATYGVKMAEKAAASAVERQRQEAAAREAAEREAAEAARS